MATLNKAKVAGSSYRNAGPEGEQEEEELYREKGYRVDVSLDDNECDESEGEVRIASKDDPNDLSIRVGIGIETDTESGQSFARGSHDRSRSASKDAGSASPTSVSGAGLGWEQFRRLVGVLSATKQQQSGGGSGPSEGGTTGATTANVDKPAGVNERTNVNPDTASTTPQATSNLSCHELLELVRPHGPITIILRNCFTLLLGHPPPRTNLLTAVM